MEEYFNVNKALWDAKTAHHVKSDFYDNENFKKGKSSLVPIDLDAIGDKVNGKTMLHLQCHFGQDSMSWARMGAKVTGVDFSPEAIKTARGLNEELGLDVKFIESNVYDIADHLDEQFDIIYCSYGVTCWLPDLVKWAGIINQFLKPGGTFYIAEFHPTFYLFDWDNGKLGYHYFNKGPYVEEEEGTYADNNAPIKKKEYFWTHSLMEIMNPLIQQGLQVTEFKEYPYSPYNISPNMKEVGPGQYKWDILGVELPHVYSLTMTKP